MASEKQRPESIRSFLKPLRDREFRYISELVYFYCGINLHPGKKELVRARLCRRLRDLGHDSFEEYCRYLKENNSPEEMTVLLDTISTNLTGFFREQLHFTFLQKELPAILERKKESGSSRLRIWSTACSSGEEPYSIALVAAEMFSRFPGLDAKILATDISAAMLQRGIGAVYRPERIKNIPAHLKIKYLIPYNGCYKIHDLPRSLVTFRKLNVIGEWPFKGPFDIIFCRNMMIYFDKNTQARLVGRLYDYLTPGGLLFVGHSESLVSVPHRFSYVEPTVYRK